MTHARIRLGQAEPVRSSPLILYPWHRVWGRAVAATPSELSRTQPLNIAPDVRLIDRFGAEACLTARVLPWQSSGGVTVVAASTDDAFVSARTALEDCFGAVIRADVPTAALQDALVRLRRRHLAKRAETRLPLHQSCRDIAEVRLPRLTVAALAGLLAFAMLAPLWTFVALTAWAVLTLVVNSTLRAMAALAQFRQRRDARRQFRTRRLPDAGSLPVVSVMVPLFHERQIAEHLIQRLSKIDYPKDRLDLCLIVEEDDAVTQQALAAAALPSWMRMIIVPRAILLTKPRAMNYALDFCRGEIIGIYDAEDWPDSDQISKITRRFAVCPPDVACLQGQLAFYNARQNWLSRCFAIDYAMWFRLILPGLVRLGFAIPLGGTTLFLRREAIEKIGGWDAHNVTEDADLGLRLARNGYRTEMIETTTREEANCRPWPWVRQRSRWIKGYAITYAVQMRNPGLLLRQLGAWRFLGVQALFLGAISSTLFAPFLWSFWLVPFGITHPLQAVLSQGALLAILGIFILAEITQFLVAFAATPTPAHRGLIWWVPVMHLYGVLATIAGVKALFELVTRPFYWDKTEHGFGQPAVSPT